MEFKIKELENYPMCYSEILSEAPVVAFFEMLGYNYIETYLNGFNGHNIDNWLLEINTYLITDEFKEFYGDNVCVFFENKKAKIIFYWDWESGLDKNFEVDILVLRNLIIEWKVFVIQWHITLLRNK